MVVDANGVDLLSGDVAVPQLFNSIGPSGSGGLSASKTLRVNSDDIYSDTAYISITNDPQYEDPIGGEPGEWTPQRTTLVLNGRSVSFAGSAGTQITGSEDEGAGTFNTDATPESGIIYTLPDGAKAVFAYTVHLPRRPAPAVGYLKSITYPSGDVLTYSGPSVQSSLGYAIESISSVINGYPTFTDSVAYNLTQSGGPGFVGQTTLGRAAFKTPSTPPVNSSNFTATVTLASGQGVRTYTVATTAAGYAVTSVSIGGSTWTYAYARVQDHPEDPYFVDGILTTTVTAPNGVKRIVTSRVSTGHVLTDREGIVNGVGGRLTTYAYRDDNGSNLGYGPLSKVTLPGGDAYGYVWGAYSNLLSRTHYPKNYGNGTVFTPPVIRAGYNCRTATGINTTICNQPDWTRDARDAQTDYTYDPVHGGVLTVTGPAPTSGAVRPQVRYTYGQFTAMYVRDGVMQPAVAPVWRLTQTSTCKTLATCTGTADEIVTSYAYQPSNAPNNVRLLSTTTRAGDNSVSATTSYTYNDRGDVITVDGPLPGNADTTRSYYDASRWKTGEIGPDPDGSGTMLRRAARTTYNADGKVTLAETGTATSQADNAMDSFAPLAFTRSTYGTTGQVTKVEAGQP
jgi:hypothetical protein